MKIAIDITPISLSVKSAHKVRGVGMYVSMLKDNLGRFDKKNSYIFFERGKKLSKDIDLIHYPYLDPFFLTLPFYKKIKSVVTVHDLTPIVFKKNFPIGVKGDIKWRIQRRILKTMNGIITDSKSSKDDIKKITGIDNEKIKTIYLAADQRFKKKELSKGEKKGLVGRHDLPDKFLLYVGDATWNKNLPRLMDAVSEANVPIVMVGKVFVQNKIDQENLWNKDLVEVLEKAKQNKNIILTGFVSTEDLVLLYNTATALLMPSLYEGFGLPVLEAMKCGCPVITSVEGSLPEVAGKGALFVNAYDTASIAKGIREVLENEILRNELSEKGREQARKFNVQKMIEEIVKVYEGVVSRQ